MLQPYCQQSLMSADPADIQYCVHVASYGVSVTIRKEMGDAIQAACGQLKVAHGRKEEIHE